MGWQPGANSPQQLGVQGQGDHAWPSLCSQLGAWGPVGPSCLVPLLCPHHQGPARSWHDSSEWLELIILPPPIIDSMISGELGKKKRLCGSLCR